MSYGVHFYVSIRDDFKQPECCHPAYGFKMFVHSPAEFPPVGGHHFYVPLEAHVNIAVKPDVTVTSDELHLYSSEKRQCYFMNERYLQFFRIYTQDNCDYECITNYTYAKCGCVYFYMPHNKTMALCDTNNGCLNNMDFNNLTCDCLPSCTEIRYDIEMSHYPVDWKSAQYNGSNIPENNKRTSKVAVYSKANQFFVKTRKQLYGFSDLLGSAGGLLGLFMGFSLLSLVEIIYFFTLRLCCPRHRQQSGRVHIFQ
ncbi:pickpocket protein 28-like [Periplaneta americana]|uniref:pickpocket protein 28-like n=1 Tax=Periplaneta americana TaxID=6978 RepID=UPI0037E922BC